MTKRHLRTGILIFIQGLLFQSLECWCQYSWPLGESGLALKKVFVCFTESLKYTLYGQFSYICWLLLQRGDNLALQATRIFVQTFVEFGPSSALSSREPSATVYCVVVLVRDHNVVPTCSSLPVSGQRGVACKTLLHISLQCWLSATFCLFYGISLPRCVGFSRSSPRSSSRCRVDLQVIACLKESALQRQNLTLVGFCAPVQYIVRKVRVLHENKILWCCRAFGYQSGLALMPQNRQIAMRSCPDLANTRPQASFRRAMPACRRSFP